MSCCICSERRGLLQGNSSIQQGQDPANGELSDEDGTVEVTPVMVLIFVILICGTLLLLYFFYDYLVYLVIVLFCLAACNGLFECLRPIVLWLPLGMYTVFIFFIISPCSFEISCQLCSDDLSIVNWRISFLYIKLLYIYLICQIKVEPHNSLKYFCSDELLPP